MKMECQLPKLGVPEQYIGKPFKDANGKTVGIIIDCQEIDDQFKLLIEGELPPDISTQIYYSFSKRGDIR